MKLRIMPIDFSSENTFNSEVHILTECTFAHAEPAKPCAGQRGCRIEYIGSRKSHHCHNEPDCSFPLRGTQSHLRDEHAKTVQQTSCQLVWMCMSLKEHLLKLRYQHRLFKLFDGLVQGFDARVFGEYRCVLDAHLSNLRFGIT